LFKKKCPSCGHDLEKKKVWYAKEGFLEESICLKCGFMLENPKLAKHQVTSHTLLRQYRVEDSYNDDRRKNVIYIDANDMALTGTLTQGIMEIKGKKRTVAKYFPLRGEDEGKKIVRMDTVTRFKAGVTIGEQVMIRRIDEIPVNESVILAKSELGLIDTDFLAEALENIPVAPNDEVTIPWFGKTMTFQIMSISPDEANVLTKQTTFHIFKTLKNGRIVEYEKQDESIEELQTETEQQQVKDSFEEPLPDRHTSRDSVVDTSNATRHEMNCVVCGIRVDFSSGKKCKFCGEYCCFKHIQLENHQCIKTRYVKFIRKTWLRRMGQNITGGNYMVVCDQCGFRSNNSYPIDIAGFELENHLQSKGCQENSIFLEQTNEDEIDKLLGRPEQSSDEGLSWMYDCLATAKEIIIKYHKVPPTDENYQDCESFLTRKTFEIDIQKTRESAYGYINLYEDFKSQNHYQIGIHESLSEDTKDNRGMVTVVLIHELLHALHPSLTHSEPEGINFLERKLANLGLHYDALRNMEILYLSGKMRLCSK